MAERDEFSTCGKCGWKREPRACPNCGHVPESSLTDSECDELAEWLESANPIFRNRVLAAVRGV